MKCNRIDALRIFGKKSWLIFFIIISAVQQQNHIMISYQWDVQPQVLKIRERLKQAGYNVWIDVEQMRKGKQWDEIYHLIEAGRLPKYQVCQYLGVVLSMVQGTQLHVSLSLSITNEMNICFSSMLQRLHIWHFFCLKVNAIPQCVLLKELSLQICLRHTFVVGGSTLEAMAKAVENASVVVPVLTDKYKNSPPCRQGG